MRKLLFLFLAYMTSANATVTFEITNLCNEKPYIIKELDLKSHKLLSDITLEFLKENKIKFLGNHSGLKSIIGTPLSNQSLEVISDREMRSYGWCYEVDGEIPSLLMSEVNIKPKHVEHIKWFYGYAEFNTDTWTSYCVPVYANPQPFICDKLWENLDQ